jgi:hypothetical protein
VLRAVLHRAGLRLIVDFVPNVRVVCGDSPLRECPALWLLQCSSLAPVCLHSTSRWITRGWRRTRTISCTVPSHSSPHSRMSSSDRQSCVGRTYPTQSQRRCPR